MIDLMNPWGLYLFAILVPVIILYLLRPKPKELRIPSLMFIKEIETQKRFSSFLKKIVRDPLLLLQLFILSLIIIAIANPFYTTTQRVEVKRDIVIIIDLSASMQASNPSGFTRAIDSAYSIISDMGDDEQVSIVLAENIPVIVLKEGGRDSALSIINKLSPAATQSGVGGAIRLGTDLLKESTLDKKMYVISDFSRFVGEDPRASQKIATVQGIDTEFIDVSSGRTDNVGIIDFEGGRDGANCYGQALVKNYGSSEKDVELSLFLNNDFANSKQDKIVGGATKLVKLSAKCSEKSQKMVVSLTPKDVLDVDNHAYYSIPKELTLDVLLIKDEDDDENIKFALESLKGVSVSETHPPIFPESYNNYDLVVFQNAKNGMLLKGVFREIGKAVDSGTDLVVIGFKGLLDVFPDELEGLLPVEPLAVSNAGGVAKRVHDHKLFSNVDIDKIKITNYLQCAEREGSVVLSKINDFAAIATWQKGAGDVVYIGINPDPEWSDFSVQTSFPIFWSNLVYWLNRDNLRENGLNFKTGERIPIESREAQITKPSGAIVSGLGLVFDEAGFYETENGVVMSASLLDEAESDISHHIKIEGVDIANKYTSEATTEERQNELFWILALVSLVLIVFEWIYVKRRGGLPK